MTTFETRFLRLMKRLSGHCPLTDTTDVARLQKWREAYSALFTLEADLRGELTETS